MNKFYALVSVMFLAACAGEPDGPISISGETTGAQDTGGDSCGCEPGAQGEPGQDGAPGAQGEKGDVGEQGPQGPQGVDGAAGPQGPSGDGVPGPAGPQGSAGPQGPQGLQGPSGAQGVQGPQGTQGPKGDTGNPGAGLSKDEIYDVTVQVGVGTTAANTPVTCSDGNDILLHLVCGGNNVNSFSGAISHYDDDQPMSGVCRFVSPTNNGLGVAMAICVAID